MTDNSGTSENVPKVTDDENSPEYPQQAQRDVCFDHRRTNIRLLTNSLRSFLTGKRDFHVGCATMANGSKVARHNVPSPLIHAKSAPKKSSNTLSRTGYAGLVWKLTIELQKFSTILRNIWSVKNARRPVVSVQTITRWKSSSAYAPLSRMTASGGAVAP